LRDIYLKQKKELVDFDFCVEKKTLPIVREFAKKISSKFIVLDKDQESFRVILKKNKIYTYDFTRMRGINLEADLALRDFTINTLTVSLSDKRLKLIDYLQGRKDIKKIVFKGVRDLVIPQDSLRIL